MSILATFLLQFFSIYLFHSRNIWVYHTSHLYKEPHFLCLTCSRLLAGSEALAEALKTTVDGQNISFLEAARSAGYAKEQDDISSVFLKEGSYSAFVELHIEQGPILEAEGRLLFSSILSFQSHKLKLLLICFKCRFRSIYRYSNCNCSPCKLESRLWRQWGPCWSCLDAK